METQRIRKRTVRPTTIYAFMILVLLVLLTTASYTWLFLSKTPRVSDMYMYVNSPTGMEISADPLAEEWRMQLDFRDLVDETSPLRPVTWSNQDQRFYAARYGIDGRMTGQWHPLSDAQNANRNDVHGYYIKASFYARSDVDMAVSLSPAVEVAEGVQGAGTYLVGVPLWDGSEMVHRNGGLGAENAMRIGLRITPVDNGGQPVGGGSSFYIYEPNCNNHLDGMKEYLDTPSIDGTDKLTNEAHIIRQTVTTWTDGYPAQRRVVFYEMGDFIDDPYIFSLQKDRMVRIDLYVWLEGQDADCSNEIEAAQIFASIQFDGEPASQGGLVPIPGR